MKATFQSTRNELSTLIDINARNEEDMEKVEKIVAYLKSEFGYEEIAADHDLHITMGIEGSTIEEMKANYNEAKKATR